MIDGLSLHWTGFVFYVFKVQLKRKDVQKEGKKKG